MDRELSGPNRTPSPAGQGGAFRLPSRRAALASLGAGLDLGPVLVTGEPGVGKTWLAGRLDDDFTGPRSWLAIDLTTATDPAGLYAGIAHALGLDCTTADRLMLGDFLAERAADGRRFGLVLDESHLAPAATLEEVRVLSNRLGRPDGFASLVLVGQSSMARRLALRGLAALAARLAARAHLRPLDVEEARDLLIHTTGQPLGLDEADQLHRAASGNPRRLLQFAASRPGRGSSSAGVAPVSAPSRPEPAISARRPLSRLGADRPPLRVEEEMIEVGWAAESEGPAVDPAEMDPEYDPNPVAVDDHYAALQAWDEWSRNQGRAVESTPSIALADAVMDPIDPIDELPAGPIPAAPQPVHPILRSEGQQGFAPYGQLYTRLRQARDNEL